MPRFRPSATFARVGTRLALSAVLVCLAGGLRPATPAGAAACTTSGATLFSSGYIRDFTSAHTDFNVADGDAATSFVAPTLGADGKPTLASGASPTTVKSAASFAQWWNDDPSPAVSQKSIASYSLSNACQPDPRVYEYVANPFYPIDNQLLGNGGTAHNSWFTYEAHNYLTYQGGEVLQYSSADDMWVYINGHLAVDLGGVHPLKTASVSLDAAQSALSITP